MANEKEPTKGDVDAIAVVRTDSTSDITPVHDGEKAQEELRKPMATKRALIAWLVLCFSVSSNFISMEQLQHLTALRLALRLVWPSVTFLLFCSQVRTSSGTFLVPISHVQNAG
jgi:hypothetical protein